MNKILNVVDLCKTYIANKRQNNVLKNVNFSVSEGEMLAIMGPSGSGKSTLLYAVSGMDKPTCGTVTFLDKEITNLKDSMLSNIRLDEMGFIFQQMYMLKNLSILDNIILPAIESKKVKDKKEIVENAKELMRKLGIIDICDNDINEVSGGQLQRACICRSLINKPKIIFADEPTGSLNRSSSDDVMNELVKINEENTSIMIVTHDVKVASKCQRILYFVDGNIAGEYTLGKYTNQSDLKERERTLNNWLMQMGW